MPDIHKLIDKKPSVTNSRVLFTLGWKLFKNSQRKSKAGLTCFGNATMAFATWRIWQAGKEAWTGEEPEAAIASPPEG